MRDNQRNHFCHEPGICRRSHKNDRLPSTPCRNAAKRQAALVRRASGFQGNRRLGSLLCYVHDTYRKQRKRRHQRAVLAHNAATPGLPSRIPHLTKVRLHQTITEQKNKKIKP
jgi:hypothetical protein